MPSPPAIDFPAASTFDNYVVLEELRGPVFGYWLASYALERSRGFYAYGKLCRDRPPSIWETPSAFAKIALGPRSTGEEALEALFQAVHSRLERRRENMPTQPIAPLD